MLFTIRIKLIRFEYGDFDLHCASRERSNMMSFLNCAGYIGRKPMVSFLSTARRSASSSKDLTGRNALSQS